MPFSLKKFRYRGPRAGGSEAAGFCLAAARQSSPNSTNVLDLDEEK